MRGLWYNKLGLVRKINFLRIERHRVHIMTIKTYKFKNYVPTNYNKAINNENIAFVYFTHLYFPKYESAIMAPNNVDMD